MAKAVTPAPVKQAAPVSDDKKLYNLLIGGYFDGEFKKAGQAVPLTLAQASDLRALGRIEMNPVGYTRRDMNPKST